MVANPQKKPKERRIKTEEKLEQISAIKERLIAEYSKFNNAGGKMNTLLDLLNKEYKFGLCYDTLNKTLSDKNATTLDFFCVLALCRYWKLDISYILSPADNTEQPMPAVETMMDSIKFKVLDDQAYLGTYYGFLSSNKEGSSDLHKLYLKIDLSPTKSFTASLGISRSADGSDECNEADARRLWGTPIISTTNNNLSILFTDNLGNLVFLYMQYIQHNTYGMYYRKGIAVTTASSSAREPIMQSFVLFNNPVPKEKRFYIPGLLLPPQKTFAVTEKNAEKLSAEDPLLEEFFDEFHYLLEHSKDSVYRINEKTILSEDSQMTIEDRIRALLLLKEKSISAGKFFYSQDNDYSDFGKNYLHRSE